MTSSSTDATPAVSVVIPTYNHRAWIRETLDSVFAQSFTDYEILLINDGSPDDTGTFVKSIVEERRIRYFEQANGGQVNARNRGIAEARGEFIAMLDDDDLWPIDKLEWQVGLLRSVPDAVMVYGSVQSFNDLCLADAVEKSVTAQDSSFSGDIREQLLQQNHICSPGQTIIRTSALKTIGGLDESLWGTDDWDLYLRLSAIGRIEYCDRLALRYRWHASNARHNAIRMCLNHRRVLRKHMGLAIWRDRELRRKQREFTAFCYWLPVLEQAHELRSHGNLISAGKAFVLAVTIHPRLLRTRYFWREQVWSLITGKRITI